METRKHTLSQQSVGTSRALVSLHYGAASQGQKVYVQASLHADEVPPMLVLHHLRKLLDIAEKNGEIVGEIVLVPYANPIGLSQHLMHDHLGRFDLNSGVNFNREYPDFYDLIRDDVASFLGPNEQENKRLVRQKIHQALLEQQQNAQPLTELASLRYTLLGLSYDADWVLDMHCDFEALMHMYVDTPYVAQVETLARFLGVETMLYAEGSGGSAFDEAQSSVWYRLREQVAGRFPIPLAGCGVTLEYRGEADVSHTLAQQDALNLYHWLESIGVVCSKGSALERNEPAQAKYAPSPLAGCESLIAPCSGVLVFMRDLGEQVNAGDLVAEIIDPLDAGVTELRARVSGKFFARENRRFAVQGMDIGKIAGAKAFKSGPLLGA